MVSAHVPLKGEWFLMMVWGLFSSHARIWGECLTIHSLPVPFFGVAFLSGDQLAHTNSTLYAAIGPQWLSELGRLCSHLTGH